MQSPEAVQQSLSMLGRTKLDRGRDGHTGDMHETQRESSLPAVKEARHVFKKKNKSR